MRYELGICHSEAKRGIPLTTESLAQSAYARYLVPMPRHFPRAKVLALFVAAFAIHSSICFAQTLTKTAPRSQPVKPETPHLEFVSEYIRELSAAEEIRATGEEENNQAKQDDRLPFAGAIYASTRFELELGSQVKILSDMRLNAPFDELISNIVTFYERKITSWRRMHDIASAFIGGPKEGVDYSKLAAEMPQIRAQLDFIDQALFEAIPSVFATLIDMKADSKGHASHLIITKEEKARLISKLTNSFGAKLDQKKQNYTVSAASVLRGYLNKDFKCSDEPWE